MDLSTDKPGLPSPKEGDETFDKQKFEHIYNNIGLIYGDISKLVPNIPEKRLIMEKITEAGMWLKMAFDMEQPANISMEHKENVRNSNSPTQ